MILNGNPTKLNVHYLVARFETRVFGIERVEGLCGECHAV